MPSASTTTPSSGRDSTQSSLCDRTLPGSVRVTICKACVSATPPPTAHLKHIPLIILPIGVLATFLPLFDLKLGNYMPAANGVKVRIYNNLKTFFKKQFRFCDETR